MLIKVRRAEDQPLKIVISGMLFLINGDLL